MRDKINLANLFSNSYGEYCPDIDGLRAIAVLAVILFHIDQSLLPGGFVGVDIFFVISGFLISRNILQDIERGRFSILDFYRRRVKRIAPAMLVVVFVTLIVSQTLMLPEDAEWVADSALWALLSLSNVYFWLFQDSGYFAADSKELPLLHLWSLGVEEQYYLLWPIILLLLFNPKRIRIFFISAVVIALISFVFGELLFDSAPSFSYYMLPTRSGELLLGALIAIATLKGAGRVVPRIVVAPLAWTGLLLLLGSLLLLSEDGVFPGLRAMPPTVGTALIILAGQCRKNHLSRLLAFKPLVWIGLVSYSAYLWHWPLLAFYKYGYGSVDTVTGIVVFGATFLLAWLSYTYVEQPARKMNASIFKVFSYQYIVPAGALAVMSLGAMYIDGYGIRSLYGNYRSDLQNVRNEIKPAIFYDYVCQKLLISEADTLNKRCVVGTASANPPDVILWGDSNAAHYVGIVGRFAQEAGFNFRNIVVGACPAIDGDPKPFVSAKRLSNCRRSLDVIRPVVDKFRVVIISSSWTGYNGNTIDLIQRSMDTARRLARSGKLVILLGKIPEIFEYDPSCQQKSLSYPLLRCPHYSNTIGSEIAETNAMLREFARQTKHVEYFDASDVLCPDGVCSAFDLNGRPIYYDRSHLSMDASWKLGREILNRGGLPAPFRLIQIFSRQIREK